MGYLEYVEGGKYDTKDTKHFTYYNPINSYINPFSHLLQGKLVWRNLRRAVVLYRHSRSHNFCDWLSCDYVQDLHLPQVQR